jgi:hypothetical protein
MGVSVLSGGAPTCHLIDYARPHSPPRAEPEQRRACRAEERSVQSTRCRADPAYPPPRRDLRNRVPRGTHLTGSLSLSLCCGRPPPPIPRPRPAPPSWLLLPASPQPQQQAMAGLAFFLVQKATPPRSHLAISLVASNEMDRTVFIPVPHFTPSQNSSPPTTTHRTPTLLLPFRFLFFFPR